MMKVKIEIHPFGEHKGKHTIAEYIIGNIGKVNPNNYQDDECMYRCWVPNAEDTITITHKRSEGAEELVRKLMAKVIDKKYGDNKNSN